MKATVSRLKPKVISYRNYKNFDENEFIQDIKDNFDSNNEPINASRNYETFVENFTKVANNHAPLKSKTIRGNSVLFMNKDWRKAIYKRTRLKNICNKKLSKENWQNYKKQRNLA